MTSIDYKGRLQRLREVLSRHKLDVLLVTHLPNIRYLCGFTGSAGVLAVAEPGSVFFTDGRYTAQARADVSGARVVVARKPPLSAAAEWLEKRGKAGQGRTRVVGIEGEHLVVAARSRLLSTLSGRFRLKEAPPLVERARMIKDEAEIELIRRSVKMGASLFDTAVANVRPGVRETDVAAEMEHAARKAGADGMSFETIIAAGKRSALPHGRASREPIPAEGFVVCDFGVILAGYCSDMTRTLYVGRPSEEARCFYEAVRGAQQAGVDAIRPGATVGKVDQAARNSLQKAGLARYFTHSTGHGVGIEIHEAPRVAAGLPDVLEPGMVVTVEPGAYIPGEWGVRIEDMVMVTERGCEVLTPTTKELIVI
jgi:Xaa-Pro aminopeptidase